MAIADSEIFWDEITAIEYKGQEEVFDLTIPETHNFIADDFIVHNCMGKKKPEEMAQQRTIFLEGAVKRSVSHDLANYIFDLMEKFAGYGFNRCVVGDTVLTDADSGEQLTIETLFRQKMPLRVHALGADGRLHARQVEDVVWNGRKPVFELITKLGKRITATANHPFRTLNGWTKLEDLKPGDRVAVLADSDISWDRVVAIEPIGIADTYDLTVERDHNFVANGIIVHNSHSAAYTLVSYQTAWLKAHYPAAFMAAVLSSDMDNTDKVVTFIEECRRMKLKITPPSVNASDYRFTVGAQGQIVYGLGAIKGVGESAIEGLLAQRQATGPFQDLFDLCQRVDLGRVNKRVLESLIRAGACDGLDSHRARLLAQLPQALALAEQSSRAGAAGQADLFGLPAGSAVGPAVRIVEDVAEWDEEQRLSEEKKTLGLYLTGHPIERFEQELARFTSARLADVADDLSGRGNGWVDKQVVIAGLVAEVRTRPANRGGRLAFITLDDRSARLEIRVFPEVYEHYRTTIVEDKVLVVQGTLSFDEFADSVRLTAEHLLDIDAARNEYARRLLLRLDARRCANGLVQELASALAPYRQGRCPVWVDYTRPGAQARLAFADDWRVRPAEPLLRELRALLGTEGVQLEYVTKS